MQQEKSPASHPSDSSSSAVKGKIRALAPMPQPWQPARERTERHLWEESLEAGLRNTNTITNIKLWCLEVQPRATRYCLFTPVVIFSMQAASVRARTENRKREIKGDYAQSIQRIGMCLKNLFIIERWQLDAKNVPFDGLLRFTNAVVVPIAKERAIVQGRMFTGKTFSTTNKNAWTSGE